MKKINIPNYTKRAVRGTISVFIFSLLSAFAVYLVRMILARELTTEEFGLFYAVFTFITFFGFFKGIGLGAALTKFIPEFQVKKRLKDIKTAIVSVFYITTFISILIYLAFFFLSDYLADNYFKDPLASLILKLLGLILILMVGFELILKSLLGLQKTKHYAFLEFLYNFLILIIVVILIYFGYEIFSPILAYIIIGPLMLLICFPIFLKFYSFLKFKSNISIPMIKKLSIYGIPLLFSQFGTKIITYIDILMLTYYRTLTEVGIYSVVYPSALLFLFFSMAVAKVMLPLISELWAKREKKKISNSLVFIYKNYLVFLAPLIFSIFAFSDIFLNILFGKNYIAGSSALQILLVGILIYTLTMININFMNAMGKPKEVTLIVGTVAFTNLIINLILIPKIGIVGAAIATTASFTLAFFMSIYKIKKIINIKLPIRNWLKTIFSSLVFVSIIFLIKNRLQLNVWIEIVISLFVAGAIYLTLIYTIKVINIEELKNFTKAVLKK